MVMLLFMQEVRIMIFAEKLKQLRIKNEYSQENLAEFMEKNKYEQIY